MADLSGQRLGQYLILERVSKGATSTVYKAYQEKLERYVAVKVLSPHFIDEEGFLDRFKQEARAVAQLDHPNILPVYDFDQVGDIVYIVMKYVESGTLKDVMGEPLDLRVGLEIFTQIGLALGYAHRQGVIHRDVKPGNILLGEGNWALLTDFGLAKMRAGNRKLTKSGVGMGTPDYMSPEQAQGLPVDGRADLYSLGCMLHEMLTGRVPFESDSGMAVVVKHITESPRPPREINPTLPLAVEQVILRSLEKDPHKRYQSAESMVADLTRAIGRADRFFFTTEPAPPAPAPTPMQPVEPGSPAEQPTLPDTPPLAEPSRWPERRAAFLAGARRVGAWIVVQVRRAGSAARAGLARLGRGLLRVAIAASTALKRGFERARAAIALQIGRRQLAAEALSSTKAGPARKRSTPTKSTAKRGQKSPPPPTQAQVIGAKARQFVSDRRVQVAAALLLLLLLFIVLVLNATGSNKASVTPTAASFAAATRAPAAPTGTPKPTLIPATGTPVPLVDTPTAEPTAPPLPDAPSGMVTVAGGTFKMGATSGQFEANETPPHWVTLDPFYIDAVEVTVAQFAHFAGGSGIRTDAEKKGDATTWRTFNAPDRQRFPVTQVSWNDAATFCRYYAKRLPTEAEWELAAKGNSGAVYTWGSAFDGNRANTAERGVGQPIAVAQLPNVSPSGAYDMVGNVWEWVTDWYGGGYYGESPAANPKGPASGLERVIRGGSFKSDGARATTTIRRKAFPDGWSDDIGFRCVKDVN